MRKLWDNYLQDRNSRYNPFYDVLQKEIYFKNQEGNEQTVSGKKLLSCTASYGGERPIAVVSTGYNVILNQEVANKFEAAIDSAILELQLEWAENAPDNPLEFGNVLEGTYINNSNTYMERMHMIRVQAKDGASMRILVQIYNSYNKQSGFGAKIYTMMRENETSYSTGVPLYVAKIAKNHLSIKSTGLLSSIFKTEFKNLIVNHFKFIANNAKEINGENGDLSIFEADALYKKLAEGKIGLDKEKLIDIQQNFNTQFLHNKKTKWTLYMLILSKLRSENAHGYAKIGSKFTEDRVNKIRKMFYDDND